MSAILDVSKALKVPGQEYAFQADAMIEDMEVLSDPVSFDEVTCEGTFFGTGERISVKGEAHGKITSRCCRCLEPVSINLSAEVDAVFARQIDPEDPDLYIFEGSKIDITDAVRDALLLELPYRFLCSEDCKGLCPRCGSNLNLGTCTCQEGGEATNPFSALKAILHDDGNA